MSGKNHIKIDGRLLQTDKKFSALKERQKTKVAEWFYEGYRSFYMESGRFPDRQDDEKILSYVFGRIEEAQIWIPDGEIYSYYRRRKQKLRKRLEKELSVVPCKYLCLHSANVDFTGFQQYICL